MEDAVEEQPGRQRAEHEVLDRRLRAGARVAVERDQRVEAECQQLESQVGAEKAPGRDHDAHAQRREQPEHVELAAIQPAGLQVAAGIDERQRGHHEDRDLEGVGQRIAHEVPGHQDLAAAAADRDGRGGGRARATARTRRSGRAGDP